MSRKRALREILSLATEDYYGLWEVRRRLHAIFPGLEDSAIRQLAANTVGELLERGWVGLFTGTLRTNDVRRLAREELASILGESTSWDEPRNDEENLMIAATPEGEAAYLTERQIDDESPRG